MARQVIGGRYELTGRIGQGGMGQVYEGYDNRLDRKVAVKFMNLPTDVRSDEAWTKRFMHEARIMAKLTHLGTPTIHDVDILSGTPAQPYIVMEFVDGFTLGELAAIHKPVPIGWVASIGAQVSAVLAAAHRRGIFHRDLKPSNVMLCAEGTVKVLDFGLAMFLDGSTSRLTRSGTALGTPSYMAPEQIRIATVVPQTDLYSLGLVLHELLTGDRVITGETDYVIWDHQINAPAPEIAELRPDIPADMGELIMRLLAKNPEERPRDAAAVHAALLPYATDLAPLSEVTDPFGPVRLYASALGTIAAQRDSLPHTPPRKSSHPPISPLSFTRGDIRRAMERAQDLADESRYEQAIEALDGAVGAASGVFGSQDSDVVEARLKLAEIRFESNDFRGAADLYTTLIRELASGRDLYDPQMLQCRKELATCHVLMGDTSNGLGMLKRLLRLMQAGYGESDHRVAELLEQISQVERAVN